MSKIEADFASTWVYLAYPDTGLPFRPNVLIEFEVLTRYVLAFNVYVGMPLLIDVAHLATCPGAVEHLLRKIHNEHDRHFAGGSVFFDPGMTYEARREITDGFRDGSRRLPTIAEYRDSLQCWIEQYHDTPVDVLGGRSPNQARSQLNQERTQ
jgi:hypothetical protein